MLNWISSACIVLAGQAGPLYVNTTISMAMLLKNLNKLASPSLIFESFQLKVSSIVGLHQLIGGSTGPG